jgi:hypothetical protein
LGHSKAAGGEYQKEQAMRLVGMMCARNEAHEIGLTARAALLWCDELVILVHASTDSTYEIAEAISSENPGRVWLFRWKPERWDEMPMRQEMLCIAREHKATHLSIIDCDEILTGNLLHGSEGIEMQIAVMPKGHCLQLPMYQLRGSLDRYHSNGIWGNRWLSVAFQDDLRLSWSGDKFHSREPLYPDGGKLKPYRPIAHGQGGSMHLWGVSERRLAAKHALYKVTERLRWPKTPQIVIEEMYNLWRSPADALMCYPDQKEWGNPWTFADVPAEWWARYAQGDNFEFPIDINAEPWQIAEVRRLVAEHGAETFRGLDLFGIVQ